MFRINRFYFIIILQFIFVVFFVKYFERKNKKPSLTNLLNLELDKQKNVENITCLIDGIKRLQCLKRNNEIYIPFYKFLKKQFNIYGKLKTGYFFL